MTNRRAVTTAMIEGLSLPQPPRISINNTMFTLIDRAGNEQMCNLVDPQVGRYLDVIIIGANPVKSKIYYADDWNPQASDPPACWSDNGVAPSNQAPTPQAPTCGQCQWNVIGSDVSKLSGKQIKACQDRKKLACFVVGDPSKELYQFQVTPAALKGLAAYGQWVAKHPSASRQGAADVSEVITRLYFAQGQQGVIAFAAVAGIDSSDNLRIDAAYDQGLVAEVIGTNDVPISGLLAAPETRQQIAPPAQQQWAPPAQQQIAPPAQQFMAAPPVNQAPPPAAAPPPPPQPVWDAASQQWVLPAPAQVQPTANQYPPPPANEPHPGVPAFLQRQPQNPPGGAPGHAPTVTSPAFPGAEGQLQTARAASPSNAFTPAPPAAGGKGKGRGGARNGAGRPKADTLPDRDPTLTPQPTGAFQAPAQPPQPQRAPFMPGGAGPAAHAPPPQAQFGMAPAGPPPADMAAALDRAFSTPLPGR